MSSLNVFNFSILMLTVKMKSAFLQDILETFERLCNSGIQDFRNSGIDINKKTDFLVVSRLSAGLPSLTNSSANTSKSDKTLEHQ